MFPYFTIFGKMITTYMLCSLVGIFVAGVFVCRVVKKRGYDDNDAIITLLFAAIGVLVGGHLLYGITNVKYLPLLFSAESFSQFMDYLVAIFGGSVFYGGLIGSIIATLITLKVMKKEIRIFSDMLTLVIPLFHGFARIGCFLGGCCYGVECEWGITVTGNTLVPDINGVPRFPVQLLEAILNFVLFFALYAIYKKSLIKPSLQGKLIFIYLLSYSVIRFFDEFLRGDEIRGFIFGMSTSQFISILLFAFSVISLVIIKLKSNLNRTAD